MRHRLQEYLVTKKKAITGLVNSYCGMLCNAYQLSAACVTTRPPVVHEGVLQQARQGVRERLNSVLMGKDTAGVVATSNGSLASSKMMAISLAHISQHSTPPRHSVPRPLSNLVRHGPEQGIPNPIAPQLQTGGVVPWALQQSTIHTTCSTAAHH